MKTPIIILFIFTSFLSFSQTSHIFSPSEYLFQDEKEIIIPRLDYSDVFIVFQKDITDEVIAEFEHKFSSLTHDRAQSFPWKNRRLYQLDPSKRRSHMAAETYLAEVRGHTSVLSAYPAFIKDKDIAYLDNIMLLSMEAGKASHAAISGLTESFGGQIVEELNLISSRTYAVRVPSDVNIFTACMELSRAEDIISAQPNFYFSGKADIIPNDPLFDDQWFLNQSSDADIDAPEAWDITTGSTSIAVAVIDGHGYDLDHAEMLGKFISPYNGVEDNNNPEATESDENHGTPCAGLIGALTNNATGVAGVGYNTLVVPIKMGFNYGPNGTFTTSELILLRSCEHVMISPYDIVAVSNSYTMGSWANIATVRDAFAYMRTDSRGGLGCVVLAATGNENIFNSVAYPFHFPHVVGVGSTNRFDARSSFSNYGDSTDLVAPGTGIWTLDRTGTEGNTNNDYYEFSGTSAACPIAAGVVSLIASVHPTFTWQELQNRLCTTCDKIDSYSFSNNSNYPYSTWNQQVGYGRLNAYQSVQGGTGLNPPENLTAYVTGSDVHLNWASPGGGTEEELIYDNNEITGSYRYPGFTLSTHMTPAGPCQILKLKYYTINQGANQFNAKVFGWSGGQPSTEVLYSSTQSAPNDEWIEIDVTESSIYVDADFVVGFGSIDTMAYIGYDAILNNGRSWDYEEPSGPWTTYDEAYLIRAVVMYPNGKIAELRGELPPLRHAGMEKSDRSEIYLEKQKAEPIPNQFQRLLGLLGYKVYRDGSLITANPIPATTYEDQSLSAGTYYYTVSAVYDEGESNPAGPVEAIVSNLPLDPPTNLQTSVNGSDVNLSWSFPGGGHDHWIYYHDGTFEDSFASTEGEAGLAQLFTLSSSPVTLEEIRFFTTDFQQWEQSMSVYVLSEDGSTILGGPYSANGVQNGWVSIPVSVSINQYHFMIATYNDNAGGPYVGADDSFFNETLYFGNHITGFTELSQSAGYEFIGSHEARILYDSKSSRGKSEWIKPGGSTQTNVPAVHHEKVALSASYPQNIKAVQGYNIYRNGTKINTKTWTSTGYTDLNRPNGTYSYGVTTVYNEGESSIAGPVDVSVNNLGLDAPVNLTASVAEQTASLNWVAPGSSEEELVYDNGVTTTSYRFPGFTMSTHMSPSGPCQLITIKYYTTNIGANHFDAKIYDWYDGQPGTNVLYKSSQTAIDGGWVIVDLSEAGLNVNGDFVVGFGSVDTMAYLGYDANLNNGRSWDWEESTGIWTTWDEAYIIRAVVLYSDGTKAELGGKGLQGYYLYRNNVRMNTTPITGTSAEDVLPGWGNYVYNVSAVYNEGESAFSNDVNVRYYLGIGEQTLIEARIYPNPAKDHVILESSEYMTSVMLMGMDGRKVMIIEQPGYQVKLDVSTLDAGLYLLKITSGENSGVFKLLVR